MVSEFLSLGRLLNNFLSSGSCLAWYILTSHIDPIKLGLHGLLTEPIWIVVFVFFPIHIHSAEVLWWQALLG